MHWYSPILFELGFFFWPKSRYDFVAYVYLIFGNFWYWVGNISINILGAEATIFWEY